MNRANARRNTSVRLVVLALVFGALAGCEEGAEFSLFKPSDGSASETKTTRRTGETVERDVEAPEVFQTVEKGLWDGRPSLGGAWVAHPNVDKAQRVRITNTKNNKTIEGALFRRERDLPGPLLQVSSDAAAELGMLAGSPVELNVVALKREVIEPEPEPEIEEVAKAEEPDDAGSEITATKLDPVAGAAAAIEAADVATDTASAEAPKTEPASPPLSRGYIQVGIFTVETNANQSAEKLRKAGLNAEIKEGSKDDKPFWRVLAGPAATKAERKDLMKQVRDLGYSDAYIVKN